MLHYDVQRYTYLSEFGASLFFLHSAVSHQVVEHFACIQHNSSTFDQSAVAHHSADSAPLTAQNHIVPRTNTRFGERAFSVPRPSAWNSLPNTLVLLPKSTVISVVSRLIILTFTLASLFFFYFNFIDSVMPGRSGSQ